MEVEIHGSASQSGFQALCLELLGTWMYILCCWVLRVRKLTNFEVLEPTPNLLKCTREGSSTISCVSRYSEAISVTAVRGQDHSLPGMYNTRSNTDVRGRWGALCVIQGLYEVLCTNSKLAEPIIELLLTQVRQVCSCVVGG